MISVNDKSLIVDTSWINKSQSMNHALALCAKHTIKSHLSLQSLNLEYQVLLNEVENKFCLSILSSVKVSKELDEHLYNLFESSYKKISGLVLKSEDKIKELNTQLNKSEFYHLKKHKNLIIKRLRVSRGISSLEQ